MGMKARYTGTTGVHNPTLVFPGVTSDVENSSFRWLGLSPWQRSDLRAGRAWRGIDEWDAGELQPGVESRRATLRRADSGGDRGQSGRGQPGRRIGDAVWLVGRPGASGLRGADQAEPGQDRLWRCAAVGRPDARRLLAQGLAGAVGCA